MTQKSDIILIPGKGGKTRDGGAIDWYWHIHQASIRVGHVFINMISDEEVGAHASIQIHINANQRGKGIGRVAYRLACEESGLPTIYAHMRKSNLASRNAALAAGFSVVNDVPSRQLIMVWHKDKKK